MSGTHGLDSVSLDQTDALAAYIRGSTECKYVRHCVSSAHLVYSSDTNVG